MAKNGNRQQNRPLPHPLVPLAPEWWWAFLTTFSHVYRENAYVWPYCVLFTYKMTIFDHLSPFLPWKCLFFTTFSHFYLENAHFYVQTLYFWPFLTPFLAWKCLFFTIVHHFLPWKCLFWPLLAPFTLKMPLFDPFEAIYPTPYP